MSMMEDSGNVKKHEKVGKGEINGLVNKINGLFITEWPVQIQSRRTIHPSSSINNHVQLNLKRRLGFMKHWCTHAFNCFQSFFLQLKKIAQNNHSPLNIVLHRTTKISKHISTPSPKLTDSNLSKKKNASEVNATRKVNQFQGISQDEKFDKAFGK